MPDQKFNIPFNLDEIRKGITKLSFREARRLRGPIFEALIQELYEEGCTKMANHFKYFMLKERKLLKGQFVRERVTDEREFLLALFEHLKMSEISAGLGHCSGTLTSLKLLYQSMFLVDKYAIKFDWLLSDIYDIVMDTINHLEPYQLMYNEMIVRITYKYSIYFSKRGERLDYITKILAKVLKIAIGQNWQPDTKPECEMYKTMHEAIALSLAECYLAYAKKFINTDPEHALQLSRDAVLALAEVGIQNNKLQLCTAYSAEIQFMIECQKYNLALGQIKKLKAYIINEDHIVYKRLKCELYVSKGECYYNKNEIPKALNKFRHAYSICTKYDFTEMSGDILLCIGKTCAKMNNHQHQARLAFECAKYIFIKQNNFTNKKKSEYLLAKLNADQIFPELLETIKARSFCELYELRLWKDQCKPFWKRRNTFIDHIADHMSGSKLSGKEFHGMAFNELNERKEMAENEEEYKQKENQPTASLSSHHQVVPQNGNDVTVDDIQWDANSAIYKQEILYCLMDEQNIEDIKQTTSY